MHPKENPMRRHVWIAFVAVALSVPVAARADDVSDAMKEALKSYESGKLDSARTALGEAMQLLAQKSATGLGAALPAPLDGWKAADVETNTASLGLIGGGTLASRRYTNAEGKHVEIQIAADSPIVAQLGVIMTNPMLAGAMGKLVKIGDQRAIMTNDHEIQMLINGRILVTVNGDAPEEAKLAYAKGINTAKLSAGQ
jgi:hypothetical protein